MICICSLETQEVCDIWLRKYTQLPNFAQCSCRRSLKFSCSHLSFFAFHSEVAIGLPYNTKADSYSFGVLFWQICSLTTPYSGFSTKMHSEKVVQQGYRPKPDSSWPTTWTVLMKECWTKEVKARPDFVKIRRTVEDQVVMWQDEEGVVPTRGSEIRAKKRKKAIKSDRLDVDTRISTDEDVTARRFNTTIV